MFDVTFDLELTTGQLHQAVKAKVASPHGQDGHGSLVLEDVLCRCCHIKKEDLNVSFDVPISQLL